MVCVNPIVEENFQNHNTYPISENTNSSYSYPYSMKLGKFRIDMESLVEAIPWGKMEFQKIIKKNRANSLFVLSVPRSLLPPIGIYWILLGIQVFSNRGAACLEHILFELKTPRLWSFVYAKLYIRFNGALQKIESPSTFSSFERFHFIRCTGIWIQKKLTS